MRSKKLDLVPLDSIDSVLDSRKGIIYPKNKDDTIKDINDIDKPTLCFKCSDKDFNSIMSSFLYRVEMEVLKNEGDK